LVTSAAVLVLVTSLPVDQALSERGTIWRVADRMQGRDCLTELGVELREVRPGKNFLMLQRGLGWNETEFYVSLTVDVQYVGEYTSEGGGRTERINRTIRLEVMFEPQSRGRFESVMSSMFHLTPRPGWDVEGAVIPESARCTLWNERPSSFNEDRRNVVLRSNQ
jgi:hypothetical protein